MKFKWTKKSIRMGYKFRLYSPREFHCVECVIAWKFQSVDLLRPSRDDFFNIPLTISMFLLALRNQTWAFICNCELFLGISEKYDVDREESAVHAHDAGQWCSEVCHGKLSYWGTSWMDTSSRCIGEGAANALCWDKSRGLPFACTANV